MRAKNHKSHLKFSNPFCKFHDYSICCELNTFTLKQTYSNANNQNGYYFINAIFSQWQRRQLLVLFTQTFWFVITENSFLSSPVAFLPLILDPFLDLAVTNRQPVHSEAQRNEPKRIKIHPVSPQSSLIATPPSSLFSATLNKLNP